MNFTIEEKEWIGKCVESNRYIVKVDNDDVFVEDTDTNECVFTFNDYGMEIIVKLFRFMDVYAEEV